jgi:hypothetical protein
MTSNGKEVETVLWGIRTEPLVRDKIKPARRANSALLALAPYSFSVKFMPTFSSIACVLKNFVEELKCYLPH